MEERTCVGGENGCANGSIASCGEDEKANKYIRYYKNTFQHGGISMEEMMVPFIVLRPKG